jgi:hydrogenase maturation protease
MNSRTSKRKLLILGIGNVLMGDEGVGVHVVNEVEKSDLPADVECLDGGTGSFLLLEPMQSAEKVILIDACIDGAEEGQVRKLRPKFSKDYPKTLTAHDIGLKDLLDAFYLMGKEAPDVTLFAISIAPLSDLGLELELSPGVSAAVPHIAEMVRREASLALLN